MKPINSRELNKAYRVFVLYFLGLIAFALLSVYCFFATSRQEMQLLDQQARQYDKMIYTRQEITSQFDFIVLRLQQLSQFLQGNAADMNSQDVLMNAIQSGNARIKGMLRDLPDNEQASSFEVYRSMTESVQMMAGLKDSLAQTRFQIESLRNQLDDCNGKNKKAIKLINGAL